MKNSSRRSGCCVGPQPCVSTLTSMVTLCRFTRTLRDPSHSQTTRLLSTSLSLGTPLPTLDIVRARLRHPPALALCLSQHRHLFTSFPLALALSAIIKTPLCEGKRATQQCVRKRRQTGHFALGSIRDKGLIGIRYTPGVTSNELMYNFAWLYSRCWKIPEEWARICEWITRGDVTMSLSTPSPHGAVVRPCFL